MGILEIPRGLRVVVLSDMHGNREETTCGKTSVSTGNKHNQRLPAQHKQTNKRINLLSGVKSSTGYLLWNMCILNIHTFMYTEAQIISWLATEALFLSCIRSFAE